MDKKIKGFEINKEYVNIANKRLKQNILDVYKEKSPNKDLKDMDKVKEE